LGLIIQGPISSPGITGDMFGKGKYSIDSSKIVNFQCQENIVNLCKSARPHFEKIIVSTWDNQESRKFKEGIPAAVEVLLLQDPGPRPGKYKPKNEYEIEFLSNNKIRQFQGIRAALEILRKCNLDLIVKVRTDQYIDIPKLATELREFSNNVADRGFFVPYTLTSVPWAIPDFFIAGTPRNLLSLCELMTSSFEFHWNVHRDLFFKGGLVLQPHLTLSVMSMTQRSNDRVTGPEAQVMRRIQEIWLNGSQDLFSAMSWRGKTIEFNKNEICFLTEKGKNISILEYPIARRASIDLFALSRYWFGKTLTRVLLETVRKKLFEIKQSIRNDLKKIVKYNFVKVRRLKTSRLTRDSNKKSQKC
jgi:hypothetical protein